MELLVKIIVPILASVFAAIITFMLTRIYDEDSSIFGLDLDKYTSYKHLNNKWISYHITSDRTKKNKPYWQKGSLNLSIKPRNKVSGEQEDYNSTHDFYRLTGKIKNGKLFLFACAFNDKNDNYLAYFPNLRRANLLLGMWIGINVDQRLFSGAYILSEKDLKLSELNDYTKSELNTHLKAEQIRADMLK